MKILNVRHADLANEFYVTSEIEIVRSLNKLGHPTTLVGMGAGRGAKAPEHVRLVSSPPDRSFIFRLKLMFLLPFWVMRDGIDVVMTDVRCAPAAWTLLPLKWLGRCRLVLDVRTIPVEAQVTWRFTRGMAFAQRWFDGASMITEGTRDHVSRKMGFRFDRCVIWTSGVNVDVFDPAKSRPPEAVRERTRGRFVLFYHGSISPNRGVAPLVDAVARLKDQIPSVLLVSLSNNNDLIREHCRANGYELDDHLLLLDAVPNTQVPDYIALADVCVVPLPRIDWWEVSSPLKLMEYLAMSKPIVLTDIRAHLDVVPRESGHVVYYDPDVSTDLARAIRDAHDRLTDLARHAPEGRTLVMSRFTWDKQAQWLSRFLEQLH